MSSQGTSGAVFPSEPHLRSKQGCPGTPGPQGGAFSRGDAGTCLRLDGDTGVIGVLQSRRVSRDSGSGMAQMSCCRVTRSCPSSAALPVLILIVRGWTHPSPPALPAAPCPLPSTASAFSWGLLQAATEFIALSFGTKKGEKF